jgi:hypothetical protein
MRYGESLAKDAGDYHEADGIINVQSGKFSKDNVVDLVNNHYAREYAKGFDFDKVTQSLDAFVGYLNGLARHVVSTVDGYSGDHSYDNIRSGKTNIFNAGDPKVKELYNAVQGMR